jgi:hypothetical protein
MVLLTQLQALVQVEADLKKVANICWLEDAPRLHGCVATLETPATSALPNSDVVSAHLNLSCLHSI